MPEEYYINNRETGKTQKVTKEEYKAVHEENYNNAQTAEEKKQATIDYLTGIRSKSNAVIPEMIEMLKNAKKGYKDRLDGMERDIYSRDPLTELGRKQANAMKLFDSESEMIKNAGKYTTEAIKGTKFSKDRVQGVSAFLTGDKESDEVFIFSWADRKNSAVVILECCVKEFLKLPFDDLDLTTDRKIAKQSPVLEKMCAQYDVIVNLIAENRDTYDEMSDEIRDQFEKKIGQANGLVNYYRLMRELMTNPYYIKHENRELSYIKRKTDTPEQRHLYNLLTQTNMGLEALKCIGADELDMSITHISSLNANVVSKEQLALQKELAEREKQLEKQSFSDYLFHLTRKGKVDGLNKSDARTVFDHALKSVTAIELPEQVEDGAGSVIAVLNQFELIGKLTDEKQAYQNTYYLEHNYREITIMDEVEKLSAPLRIIKDSILKISSISEKGELTAVKASKDDKRVAQEKYSAALEEYRAIMARVDDLRSGAYIKLESNRTNDIRARGIVKPGEDVAIHEKLVAYQNPNALPHHKVTEEEAKKLREDVKDLFLTLSENDYSDIAIYRNAAKILDLNEKCRNLQGLEQKENLRNLAELAFNIRLNTRRNDVSAALEQQNLTAEDLMELNNEFIELGNMAEGNPEILEQLLEDSRKTQQVLRNEAQKMKLDTADLKAEAAHYLQQDQWARNSKKEETRSSFFSRIFLKAATKVTRFLGWAFSKTRSKVHGAQLYDSAKENLKKMPYGINSFGDEGADHFIINGDGQYAPKVELNRYFKDPMKMSLAKDYRDARELMDPNAEYPQCIVDAMDALSCYDKVRGIVNNETFEMEQAFLDKFEKSIHMLLEDGHTTIDFPELSHKLILTYGNLQNWRNGSLDAGMTKEELAAAKESKAVYTNRTYIGDTEESNVRNLPLFPHAPQLNDIKQGVSGNCYMLAAVQTLVEKDPQTIKNMFYDLGDGNVIVRFYAAFGVHDGKYVRIDDEEELKNRQTSITTRPVYVKVRKHYTTGEEGSAYCIWMQLLEKAYAAAGFNKGKPDIDENGVLHNFYEEITDGDPTEVLYHLTGNHYDSYSKKKVPGRGAWNQTEIEKDKRFSTVQRRLLFRGIPEHMHDVLYKALFNGDRDDSDYADVANWEEEYIKKAIKPVLDDIKEKVTGIEKRFDQLEKEGKLDKVEKASLVTLLKNAYLNEENNFAETIVKNINNSDDERPSLAECSNIDDIYTFSDKLNTLLEDQDVNYGKIEGLLSERHVIYEGIREREVPIKDLQKIRFSIQNLLVPNHEMRYSQDELGVLRKLKEEITTNKAVTINSKSGHSMTALDIKLHNGKWFVLIRDPFNTYRYKYIQKENGKVKTESFGFMTAVRSHRSLRKLSPELKYGFRGTSWWELKDVYKQFDSMALSHKKAE